MEEILRQFVPSLSMFIPLFTTFILDPYWDVHGS